MLLKDNELQYMLANSPKERITEEYINSRIVDIEYIKLGATATVCSIELNNGYSVRGESACVSPENYNEDIGQTLAYKNAYNKLWPLFGFLLAETRYRKGEINVSS